jgi:prepilin-type N-terminal cleavage/methylation domain-containing protein
MPGKNQGVTLIEILISLLLISVISIGIWSVELFSRQHVISADRRAQTQNEAAFVLEHMFKVITGPGFGGAIGDWQNRPFERISSGQDVTLKFYVDSNFNGMRDAFDRRLQYRYYSSGGPHAFRLFYNCIENCPASTTPGDGALISKNVQAFNIPRPGDPLEPLQSMTDYVPVVLTICWDVNRPQCGSTSNPMVSMRARFRMPSVSLAPF